MSRPAHVRPGNGPRPARQEDASASALDGPEDAAAQSVLAAMMLSTDAVAEARGLIGASDFYRVAHQKVFAALAALADRGERADFVTVTAELARRGDLEAVGGPATLAHILEAATTTANVAEHCRIVADAATKRRVRRFGLELTQRAEDATTGAADLLAHLDASGAALAASGHEPGAGRFADAAVSAADLMVRDIEKPRSLLGDGVLTAGGLAVLYGKPGMSKTFLALLLDRAMARGEPWMGLATPPEGVRVGLLQLELGAYALQSRLRTLGIGEHERDSNLHVVCRPHLRGVVDLFRQPEDMRALCAWIDRNRLGMVGIDALSRAHTANENAADELGQVLAGLDAMRHETGCAVVLVHHEPKERAGSRPDNHLDALRGTSRLQSDPTLLMRVWQSRGLRCLTFAKVSEGPTPADVFFRLGEGGRPEVTKSPESKADDNRARVLRVVLDAKRPITRAEVQEAVDLGRSAVAGHLKSLADEAFIGSVGEGTTLRYAAPTVRPSTASEHNGADGQMTLSDRHLESFPS